MNTSSNQFGLIVAYLLPGFIGLAGIAPFAPIVTAWLQPLNQSEAGLGPPIYAVLAATTVGMIASCFRWLVLDHIHLWTGLRSPVWDDRRLEERVVAFNYLVDNHYRYYQFFGNTLVALVFAYSINRLMATSSLLSVGTDLGVVVLCATLFAGSPDALAKYYARTNRLIGQFEEKGSAAMTNGNQHESGGKTSDNSRREVKAPSKPMPTPKPEHKTTK